MYFYINKKKNIYYLYTRVKGPFYAPNHVRTDILSRSKYQISNDLVKNHFQWKKISHDYSQHKDVYKIIKRSVKVKEENFSKLHFLITVSENRVSFIICLSDFLFEKVSPIVYQSKTRFTLLFRKFRDNGFWKPLTSGLLFSVAKNLVYIADAEPAAKP
jgi:hypothetical protein